MAKAAADQLSQIIAPALAALGYEFLGCEMFAQGRHSLLRIYIDSEAGVTLDDCERASRQVSAVLDVEDPISGTYELEVSSPGMDRPLFQLAHYQKFIGNKVRVRLRVPQKERRNFTGLLQEANEQAITLLVDGEIWTLPLADIEKANLVPEF